MPKLGLEQADQLLLCQALCLQMPERLSRPALTLLLLVGQAGLLAAKLGLNCLRGDTRGHAWPQTPYLFACRAGGPAGPKARLELRGGQRLSCSGQDAGSRGHHGYLW